MGLAPQVSAFLALVAPSFSANEVEQIGAACQLAVTAHAGQQRQSGEPYATHPLAVAQILFESLEPDAEAICAALLHDVVEDTEIPLTQIQRQFGAGVAHIVDGVSKLDQVRTTGLTSAKEETLRKLVVAGGRDWRVFAVKLCDRLHNMRTMGAMRVDKRRAKSRETLQVFFPLARYFHFLRIASELESLAYRWLYPRRWSVLSRWTARKRAVDLARLHGLLDGAPFVNRASSAPYPVHADVQASNLPGDTLVARYFTLLREDRASRALFSVPVLQYTCGTLHEAYADIAWLHSHFVFVPASFHSDASEGLASTKVLLGRRGLVAEFIFWFPRVARGAWAQATGDVSGIDDFATVAGETEQAGGFTQVLRSLVNQNSISVFSPKGRRLSLPRHATGLDFAFAIHTDLGLRTTAVRVNGVSHEPRVELVSGDIVEVITGEAIVARPDWESLLRSPRNRAKLRQWLRETARSDAAVLGRRLLADAAAGSDVDALLTAETGQQALASFNAATREDVWWMIGSGQLSAYAVASALLGSQLNDVIRSTASLDVRNRLVLDGRPAKGIRYCPRCQPLPGDDIVAMASYGGATVHRSECPDKSAGRASTEFFVPIWANRLAEPLPADLCVTALDRKGLLADCARAVSDTDVNVIGVVTRSYVTAASVHMADLRFTVLVRSRTKFARCLDVLRDVQGVTGVRRVSAQDGAPKNAAP
ncbi:MAG: bifunctional (p)ppGpp synthetase/guanosine-3',5'-bis(diphosphate) 3'-pyrophosphohydrolase [Burkholderiales bacterium]|nr:bifunctional (p)ppGpp synthetase/guanosine-3',5'-bis(diphosphate) 3'-pyrophosphohydrolase [Burkholderiales bacterium]